jgi:hypothetical protein
MIQVKESVSTVVNVSASNTTGTVLIFSLNWGELLFKFDIEGTI